MTSNNLVNPVIIIGAGPTGLGAAWRFQERGFANWLLFEKSNFVGGLSASFVDPQGFTWDIGGHVQFSHYHYFDHLMDTLLADDWMRHERESWIFIKERFVPYPFQYNLHRLELEDCWDCLAGLIDVQKTPAPSHFPHFADWIKHTMGEGIARLFMEPYNYKVWAYPLDQLDINWQGERVAVPDLKQAVENVVRQRDQVSWGPNNTFQFPLYGGTGQIWRSLASHLPAMQLHLNKSIVKINPSTKEIYFADGGKIQYSYLLSTMPLTDLVKLAHWQEIYPETAHLRYSSVHIVGVGLAGQPPESIQRKCWMYFPDPKLPFYRVTLFSNYSPNNVPRPDQTWSLMCEVSESPFKLVNKATIINDVIMGLMDCGFIKSHEEIISTWYHFAEFGYPTPTVGRDAILTRVLTDLQDSDIYARGRFGAWKYEVSNQDHSCMQGVEFADKVLDGKTELTVNSPHVVNAPCQKIACSLG